MATAESFSGLLLAQDQKSHEIRFQCTWHTGDTVTDASGTTSWKPINIVFKKTSKSSDFSWPNDILETRLSVESSANELRQINSQDFGSTEAFRFVLECLLAADLENEVATQLVMPRSRGYIVRPDIIPLRLVDCPLTAKVVSLSKLHHYYDGESISIQTLQELPLVFAGSAGGMILKPFSLTDSNSVEELFTSLSLELRNRLCFPWLSTQVPRRKTLAIVDGGISGPDHGGTGESIYTAAMALGIDMIVLDSPNHWVNDPRFCHWRKANVPLECPLHPDAGFVDRIVEAVRSYNGQIDGIVTLRDHYKLPVAEAALKLSLPTYPPSAYEIATDKFKTSVSEGHHAYVASSAEEAAAIVQEHNLEFPLIIKPTNGFLSEGVFRAENLSQLKTGVQAIHTDRHGNEFVIEKYCEGPEVDANLVLCDGELILFEVSDDFPKSADANGRGNAKTFIELANVLPSKLPKSELDMLKDALTKSLLRMGFRDGFYHLEARVENSSMDYAIKNNVLDLFERDIPAKGVPASWLIEVNPRPPGIQALSAVNHTYGIDYCALALLFALEDKERIKQLSHMFVHGPQYWCEMVFIPVEKGGVYESGDVCAELFERRPDLAAFVSRSFCFLKKGDNVADPLSGINSWVAYFNVFSRKSREHLLEMAETVRREVRFSIV
ncbi:predicted protein [Uncinocarpus reesii 1704]|uniref:ATP-grasp enzyme uncK n=1 Tax=Uncinocarpus reesii (strain UAMH 1704) TaxID=336963 RepID=UNCK_UNCRE|nr:uncharacterized protein UREG_02304 [Uncinocarpus reesii 1704]EEP77455.1 predicted protein [Uncinocarpus reesii 1704]